VFTGLVGSLLTLRVVHPVRRASDDEPPDDEREYEDALLRSR